MQNKFTLSKCLMPVLIIFILSTALFLFSAQKLDEIGVNHKVLIGANAIIFITSVLAIFMHFQSAKSSNAYAVSRSVLGATSLKLFILAGSVIIYLLTSGPNRSILAIFGGLALYVLYTIFEVRVALQMNKK